MLARLEAAEILGEDAERALDRRVDDDRGPDGRRGRLGAHLSSFTGCSTAALKAARAYSRTGRDQPQGAEPDGVELVDAPLAGAPVEDQPGVLQHLEVLRDGRPADGARSPARRRPRAFGEALEDRPSRRIAERRPSIGLVSLHERVS